MQVPHGDGAARTNQKLAPPRDEVTPWLARDRSPKFIGRLGRLQDEPQQHHLEPDLGRLAGEAEAVNRGVSP